MKDNLLTYRQKQHDRLIRCVAAKGTVRLAFLEGTELVREARRIHDLSRVATAAMGRQLMMTVIMAADLKGEKDLVSTIIKGDGPAGSMICTGNSRLEVKGSVLNGDVELPPTPEGKLDVGGFVGHNGKLSVVSDLGLKEPYVGLCNLVSGEIAVDFANYYAASLQRPALVYLGVREDANTGEVRSAAGVFAEPMPGCPEETIDKLQALSGEISSISERLDAGESLENLIDRIFGGFDVTIADISEPVYHCDCTRERVEKALISIGTEELKLMIAEDHGAEVACRFCDKKYKFSEYDLEQLLEYAAKREDEE
ncbi:MAG: Hsp33 family molecular chaperone HslO [Eubacteriales bacterium]|nr:Hsp33 family molecular chaperone HslO [Eubacteriales bacterium]